MSADGKTSLRPAEPATSREFEEVRRVLLLCVRRSCPTWLLGEAEDLVHVALTRLLASPRLESGGIGDLSPSYLARAAYHVAVDEMRRRFRRREQQASEDRMLDETPSPSAGPEAAARASEIHRGLRACLASLIRPRRIAVACHLQGYSVPEASAFTGWSKKKTEHLVRRGMDDLRECLKSKGLEP